MTSPINQAWIILKEGPPKPGLWQRMKDNAKDFTSGLGGKGGNFRENNQRIKDRQASRQASRQAEWDATDEGQAAAAQAAEQQQQQAFKNWKAMPQNDPKWNEFQRWQAQQGQTPATPQTTQPATQPATPVGNTMTETAEQNMGSVQSPTPPAEQQTLPNLW